MAQEFPELTTGELADIQRASPDTLRKGLKQAVVLYRRECKRAHGWQERAWLWERRAMGVRKRFFESQNTLKMFQEITKDSKLPLKKRLSRLANLPERLATLETRLLESQKALQETQKALKEAQEERDVALAGLDILKLQEDAKALKKRRGRGRSRK